MITVYRALIVTGFVLTVGGRSSWGGPHPTMTSATPMGTPPGVRARSLNTTGTPTRPSGTALSQHHRRFNTASGSARSITTPPATTTRPAGPTRSPQHHRVRQHRQRGRRALLQHHRPRQHRQWVQRALSNTTGELNTASGASAL